MTRNLAFIPIAVIAFSSASGQSVSIVFGNRVDDNAEDIFVFENTILDIDLWIRTDPGIVISRIQIPLASSDAYFTERPEGEFFYPLYRNWESEFTEPLPDSAREGYTVQSLVAGQGGPENLRFIRTDGQWWKIAAFKLKADYNDNYDSLYCDIIAEGIHPEYGGIGLFDAITGELDRSMISIDYSCVRFSQYSCGYYVLGDFNGSGGFNLADIISALSKLQTGSPNAYMNCECPPNSGNSWPIVFDLNNSCTFNIADIYVAMTRQPYMFEPCEHCPPQ